MRFLVMTVPGPTPPLPPDAMAGMIGAFRDWMHKQQKAGKIEQAYGWAEGRGGCGIANVDSHEELNELLLTSPMGPLTSYEIRALVDFDRGTENAERALKAMTG